jgi:CRP/FNR family cyclic AMP-dependent transcriptional regulator
VRKKDNSHAGGLQLPEVLALRRALIFKDLPEEALRAALARCVVRCYAEGLPIFQEDEPATHVYLLLSGNASVSVCDAKGRWWRVHTAGPGDLLGVSAVFSGSDYRLSTVCESPSTVAAIHRDDFFGLLSRFPQAYFRVAECLSRDLAAAYDRLAAFGNPPRIC